MQAVPNDEIETFRREIRAFIEVNLTPALAAGGRAATSVFCDPAFTLPWQKILHARGWAAPAWPKEYGGAGWSETQCYAFAQECARAGAPSLAPMGLKMVGPCIIQYGTPAQRAYYLPRILSGEDYWCQGYSEPAAGSDLAALKTRAVRDGEDYVVTGSKIWTTHAHFSNKIFALVRTNPDARPQAGITFLLIDMKSPGVTVRPISNLAGEHEFNEVFFDDVRIPIANRLGDENDGWTVAKYLLEFERGGSFAPGLQVRLERLRALGAIHASEESTAHDLRMKVAEEAIALTAIGATEQRVIATLADGQNPGALSSMLKTQGTEAMQRIETLGVEIAGPRAAGEPEGVNAHDDIAAAAARYFNSRAGSIYGGSNEVQRNIMARLLLRI